MPDKEGTGREERKAMHGGDYVKRFEREQSIARITRLMPLMGLKGDEKIVDIGCGNALSLTALEGGFGSYTGIDFSEPFIEAARARARAAGIHNAGFFCGSAEEFAGENAGEYDVALAIDISEHVHDGEWSGILQAAFGMLKPGGRMFLHTPNSAFFVEMLKEKNFILKQFPEHIAVRNMAQNIRLIEAAGFGINATRVLPHYNILSVLHPFSGLPGVGKYFAARLFIEAVKPA